MSENAALASTSFTFHEREHEVAELEGLLAQARDGTGRLVVIDGEAGIGKSALVQAAQTIGKSTGLRVLSARASELERGFPFGVVTQLFGREVVSGDGERALHQGPAKLAAPVLLLEQAEPLPFLAAAEDDMSFPVLHGLYWLTANLAEQRPMLLTIDDVHWSDPSSLRFVSFLAPRLAEIGVVVVATVRTGERVSRALTDAMLDSGTVVLRPSPLSQGAVGRLLEAGLSVQPAPQFCLACHKATGGNPFLVHELVAVLRSEQISPTAESSRRVPQLAAPAIARAVLRRLTGLSPAAKPLSHAVAVLGDSADFELAVTLAGIDREAAAGVVDELMTAQILAPGFPLSFKHPLLAAAVYEALGTAARADLHRQAADHLRDRGATPEALAVHLCVTYPRGDAATVETLRAAATQARAHGAPEAAVVYLQRALDEPPAVEARDGVLAELGRAELRAGDAGAAARHLEAALAITTGVAQRVPVVHALSRAWWLVGRSTDATALIEATIAETARTDSDLAVRLELALLEAAMSNELLLLQGVERLQRLRERLPEPSTDTELLAVAVATVTQGWFGASAAEVTEAGQRVLAQGGLLADVGPGSPIFWQTLFRLVHAEALSLADAHTATGIEEARRRGHASGFVMGTSLRAQIALRRGDILGAMEWGETAIEAMRLHPSLKVMPHGAAYLIHALLEHDELERASDVIDACGYAGELPDDRTFLTLRASRGFLCIAQGNLQDGVDDLMEFLRRVPGVGAPVLTCWLAPALVRMGRRDEALATAQADLERSQHWGAPGQIGIALRTCGLLEGGDGGVELLRAAVDQLLQSEMRLEYARALVELGAALRRAGRRADARKRLTEGFELAQECGGRALESRARQELLAAGARPRRAVRTGIDDLTPSERRVAVMAAEGMSNPEIAAALFVTTKTIETHLSHVYSKLAISSRWKLASALAGTENPNP